MFKSYKFAVAVLAVVVLVLVLVAQLPLSTAVDVTRDCLFYRDIGTFLSVPVSNSNEFVKVEIFTDSDCAVADSSTRLIADLGDQSIIIGRGGLGIYSLEWQASARSASGVRTFIITIGLTRIDPLVVTGATDTSPIVITSLGHNLSNGDLITVIGVGGNTAANGDWEIQDVTFDTFSVVTLSGIVSSGNGAFTTNGEITIFYSGIVAVTEVLRPQSEVLQSSNIAKFEAKKGDKMSMYIANLDTDSNAEFDQIGMELVRFSR